MEAALDSVAVGASWAAATAAALIAGASVDSMFVVGVDGVLAVLNAFTAAAAVPRADGTPEDIERPERAARLAAAAAGNSGGGSPAAGVAAFGAVPRRLVTPPAALRLAESAPGVGGWEGGAGRGAARAVCEPDGPGGNAATFAVAVWWAIFPSFARSSRTRATLSWCGPASFVRMRRARDRNGRALCGAPRRTCKLPRL